MAHSDSRAASGSQARLDTGGLAKTVASHYNNIEERGAQFRKESPIYYMRNLNNWIKSQLINQYTRKIEIKKREKGESPGITVLDLGCGKGGDLLKWQKARVDHVVCCDIAGLSVEQCQDRYDQNRRRNRHIYSAEFHTADCTRDRLIDVYEDPDTYFDLVSCQFAFHYCFESLPQAERMLQNAAERLKKGGFFIGTTPDANDIVNRAREFGQRVKGDDGDEVIRFGNDIFSIAVPMKWMEPSHQIPIFGAKYDFHLEGVVDCPEFLVHFPTLTKLAEKYGLILVAKRRFANYFQECQKTDMEGERLLCKMKALESFPGHEEFSEEKKSNYQHAVDACRKLKEEQNESRSPIIGTLSRMEWEAASIYVIFAFMKI
ncbi:hypothetical protein TCAL_06387 [Tigriopus californicus]|uniref:mRNA cap guanine-N(7) methyltransferase n=1 Tax=Tigriopus californicus TaxID=6832 RepID=A0A553PCY6_TIGCA|nr:hypothetical protein TCAL_06387 [Tigriopus californicus]